MATFAQVRELALALPSAVEEPTWGDVTFRVNGKIFAITGTESAHVSVKASKEDQAELIASDPETYSFAPYVGRFGWVLVQLAGVGADDLRDLLTEAWRRTAPKKLVKEFDAA
ncbi:MmcQ/YjbR family DNA-binding protein [Longispora sp. NPDC051575]|uniref:MmcQ/YjbR family DNA-binding protein n=1 Tax=Longispora sp. NPDC051575 TaxID=3154943 RepID=UPI003429C8E8